MSAGSNLSFSDEEKEAREIKDVSMDTELFPL